MREVKITKSAATWRIYTFVWKCTMTHSTYRTGRHFFKKKDKQSPRVSITLLLGVDPTGLNTAVQTEVRPLTLTAALSLELNSRNNSHAPQ